MIKNICYLLTIVLLTSCSSARKIRYDGINADLPKSNSNISLAIWDQRVQVTDGSRKPDFVGYMRSGAGIAYPLQTKSGKSFSNDISYSIASSLKESGSKVIVVGTKSDDSRSMIVNKLKESKSSILLLLKCNEYHTDGFGAQGLNYDIDVIVLDKEGNIIKERKFSGKKALGGNVFWGAGKYKTYMPAAFKNVIEEIFNDQELNGTLVAKS
jgi:hypothetical protein